MTTTISDEKAFALGSRAVNAGLRLVPGMKTLHARHKWTGSIVTGLDYDGTPAVSTGLCEPFSPGNLLPDLRDPGTKGHAVAQLREKYNDPHLYIAHDPLNGNEFVCDGWTLFHKDSTNEGLVGYPTEEEAIVASFEATKETP